MLPATWFALVVAAIGHRPLGGFFVRHRLAGFIQSRHVEAKERRAEIQKIKTGRQRRIRIEWTFGRECVCVRFFAFCTQLMSMASIVCSFVLEVSWLLIFFLHCLCFARWAGYPFRLHGYPQPALRCDPAVLGYALAKARVCALRQENDVANEGTKYITK